MSNANATGFCKFLLALDKRCAEVDRARGCNEAEDAAPRQQREFADLAADLNMVSSDAECQLCR